MRILFFLAVFIQFQLTGTAPAQPAGKAQESRDSQLETIEMLQEQFPPDATIETWVPEAGQRDFHEKLQAMATGEHRTTVGPGKYHHGGPIRCIGDGTGSNYVARCVRMRVCGIPIGAVIQTVKGMASNTYDEYYYPCKELGECSTGWAKFFDRPTRTHDAGGQCVFWRFGNWKHDRARDVKLEVYWYHP